MNERRFKNDKPNLDSTKVYIKLAFDLYLLR